jgi:hypothetical protein
VYFTFWLSIAPLSQILFSEGDLLSFKVKCKFLLLIDLHSACALQVQKECIWSLSNLAVGSSKHVQKMADLSKLPSASSVLKWIGSNKCNFALLIEIYQLLIITTYSSSLRSLYYSFLCFARSL